MATAVFFANGYGDAIIARPALNALAKRIYGPIHLVCNSGPHLFLLNDLGFTSVVPVAMTKLPVGRAFDVDAVRNALGSCDTLIDMVPWSSEYVRRLASQLGVKKTIGFDPAYSIVVERSTHINAVEMAFNVCRAATGELCKSNYRFMPQFSKKALAVVDQIESWKERAGITAMIAIHADTFPEKTWSPLGFQMLIDKIISWRPNTAFAVVGANAPPLVIKKHHQNILSLESLSLEASMAVVSKSNYFIGIDSCMLHIADLAGVHGTGIFGPATGSVEWGYYWTPGYSVNFRNKEDLSPVVEIEKIVKDFFEYCD